MQAWEEEGEVGEAGEGYLSRSVLLQLSLLRRRGKKTSERSGRTIYGSTRSYVLDSDAERTISRGIWPFHIACWMDCSDGGVVLLIAGVRRCLDYLLATGWPISMRCRAPALYETSWMRNGLGAFRWCSCTTLKVRYVWSAHFRWGICSCQGSMRTGKKQTDIHPSSIQF